MLKTFLRRGSVSFRAMSVTLGAIFLASVLLSDFASLSYAYGASEPLPGLPVVSAASSLNLPSPNKLIELSPKYQPVSLRGLRFYPDDPLRFDFLVDKPEGDGAASDSRSHRPSPNLLEDGLKNESSQLIKYFLASLTIPEEDLWVNLSPYEADRVVPDELGLTDMGKDLLRQDYLLKQLMASLTYPESPLGQEFWDKAYKQAYQLFGTSKIPINTFNKVWIVPDKAVVYEDKDRVILGESRLKVMLEEDYLAFKNRQRTEHRAQSTENRKLTEKDEQNINNFSSSIMKEIILPAIEKEVNEGKNFAQLRQIYHSLILAIWFKQKLKTRINADIEKTQINADENQTTEEPILSRLYIDKKKIKGVDSADPKVKEKVYSLYLEAYKNGLYNYIKKDFDPYERKQIKRRYYSGGANFVEASSAIATLSISQMPNPVFSSSSALSVRLTPATPASIPTVHKEEVVASSAIEQQPPEPGASSAMDNKEAGRTLFAFNYHRTIGEYIQELKQMIEGADIIVLEEPELEENLFQRLSNGMLTPDEVLGKMQAYSQIVFPEMLKSIYSQIYKQNKVVYGEPQVDEETKNLFKESLKLDRELRGAILEGNLEQALRIFKNIYHKLATFNAERDLLITKLLETIRQQNPSANILVIRGSSHTIPYLLLAREKTPNIIRQFLYPEGQPVVFSLYDALQRKLSMQKLGIVLEKEPAKFELAQALISALLVNSMTVEQKNKINFALLNRVAQRVNFEDIEHLFRKIKALTRGDLSPEEKERLLFSLIHLWMSEYDKWSPQEYTELFSWKEQPVLQEELERRVDFMEAYGGQWGSINKNYLGRIVEGHPGGYAIIQLRLKTTGEIIGYALSYKDPKLFLNEGRPYNSVKEAKDTMMKFDAFVEEVIIKDTQLRQEKAAQFVTVQRLEKARRKDETDVPKGLVGELPRAELLPQSTATEEPFLNVSVPKLRMLLEGYDYFQAMIRAPALSTEQKKELEEKIRYIKETLLSFSKDIMEFCEITQESFNPYVAQIGQVYVDNSGELLIYESQDNTGYFFTYFAYPSRQPYILSRDRIGDSLLKGKTHPFDLLRVVKLKEGIIDIQSLGTSLPMLPPPQAKENPTLCLTSDSLITLANGTTKSLLALKPFPNLVNPRGSEGGVEGDMVLSLNEATGRLEPHRVLALLDMGVKPVYRITTASGKQLKTTLTHPYLTKNGWRKLQEIKAGEEIGVVKDLFSAVSIFSGINSVNNNAITSKIKTDAILSDSESMGCGREVNQWFCKGQRVPGREIKLDFFNDAFLELEGKSSEFSFTGWGKLNFLNHQRLQANPNLCLIFSKGTSPNFFASSIPFLSFNTNLGFIGRRVSIASISQPTGLWNTYSLAETCSSSLTSKAQSKSHNEYVSKIKYFGESFLSTTTAALKSEGLMPAFISSLGIDANFSSASSLTGSFADNLTNDVDFIFTPPYNFKYNTLISGLSRLFSIPEAEASQIKETFSNNSDILWDKIVSIEPLGSLPVYDIEVEATHNFIAQGIVAHNTYTNADGKSLIANRKEETAGSALENKGGIDLNPHNLEMEIKGSGTSPVFMNNISLDLQNFQGFTFQIISIQPVSDREGAFALGLSEKTEGALS